MNAFFNPKGLRLLRALGLVLRVALPWFTMPLAGLTDLLLPAAFVVPNTVSDMIAETAILVSCQTILSLGI